MVLVIVSLKGGSTCKESLKNRHQSLQWIQWLNICYTAQRTLCVCVCVLWLVLGFWNELQQQNLHGFNWTLEPALNFTVSLFECEAWSCCCWVVLYSSVGLNIFIFTSKLFTEMRLNCKNCTTKRPQRRWLLQDAEAHASFLSWIRKPQLATSTTDDAELFLITSNIMTSFTFHPWTKISRHLCVVATRPE